MSTKDEAKDARPRVVRSLEARLDVARQIKDLERDPVLEIVEIENLRRSVARLFWIFLAVGLAYTTVGVQDFLAGHLTPTDPMWWGAWCVEPCLAGILLNLMRWEAAMVARSVDINSEAVSWLKRILLAATLVMNLVPALAPRTGERSFGDIFAHAMVPLVVFFLAEVMPIAQARCTQAKATAAAKLTHQQTPAATTPKPATTPTPAPEPTPTPVSTPASEPTPVTEPVHTAPVKPAAAPRLNMTGLTALGIPAGLHSQVEQRLHDALEHGRRPEPSDLASIGIPAGLAGRVITHALNGSH
jgi:hypothetical protein